MLFSLHFVSVSTYLTFFLTHRSFFFSPVYFSCIYVTPQALRQAVSREDAPDPTRRPTKQAPKEWASRKVRGRASQRNFAKLGCLRRHFVRFEGSMMWKQAAKSEIKTWIFTQIFMRQITHNAVIIASLWSNAFQIIWLGVWYVATYIFKSVRYFFEKNV